MTVISIAVIGIAAALLATQFKAVKGEYGVYLAVAAGLVVCFYSAGKLETAADTFAKIRSYIRLNSVYLDTLLKMVGIAYIAEFASGICKDAGFGSLGNQIEIFGKLSILAVSMPILLALLETVREFLS